MQLIQRKCKDTIVISEQKAESAFAPFPENSARLFPLDKISFPEPKAKSALGPKLGMLSQLFLLTRFFQFFFCPIL